jgi:hypothetical protein
MAAYLGRKIAVGVIAILSTDAVNTTYVMTTNWRPVAAEFLCCGQNSSTSTSARATATWCNGIAANDVTRGCVFGRSEDASASQFEDNGVRLDAVIAVLNNTGTIVGQLDVVTWGATSLTAIVDVQFTTSVRVIWWAHGGSHLRYAHVGSFVEPGTASTDTTITGPTQKCDVLVLMGLGSGTDPPSVAVDVRTFYGVAVENSDGTVTNAVCSYGAEDTPAAAVARSYCRTGESIGVFINGSTAVNSRGLVNKFNGSGSFVVNYPEIGAVTRDVLYLAMAGGQNCIGSLTTLTNTSGTIAADATLPFTPTGAIFVGAQQTSFPAADTVTDDGITSQGVVDSDLVHRSMARRNEHGALDMQVTTGIDYEDCWIGLNASSGATDGTMRINKFVTNDIEGQMSTAGAFGYKVWFWAVGNDKIDRGCQETVG